MGSRWKRERGRTVIDVVLGGQLIHVKAGKDLKGFVPLECKPADSLFVAASGKALIHLDGGGTKDSDGAAEDREGAAKDREGAAEDAT